MSIGKYYHRNQKRLEFVKDTDWKVALAKTKKHIQLRIKQKTISGAHASARLGAEPVEHYLGISYEKILNGDWEWKEEFTLAQQMIRIVDSEISKEVEQSKTIKEQEVKITSQDPMDVFYNQVSDSNEGINEEEYKKELKLVEDAINGDIELEIMWDALKEGKKRSEIAALLDITPKQLDKVREKLVNRVRNLKKGAT